MNVQVCTCTCTCICIQCIYMYNCMLHMYIHVHVQWLHLCLCHVCNTHACIYMYTTSPICTLQVTSTCTNVYTGIHCTYTCKSGYFYLEHTQEAVHIHVQCSLWLHLHIQGNAISCLSIHDCTFTMGVMNSCTKLCRMRPGQL